MQQGFPIDQHEVLAARDQILVMAIRPPECVEQTQQHAGAPVEAIRGGKVVAGPVLDILHPAVVAPVEHLDDPEIQKLAVSIAPGEDVIEGDLQSQILRLVDEAKSRLEGERDDGPPALVGIG
jgi:hypothetical protein